MAQELPGRGIRRIYMKDIRSKHQDEAGPLLATRTCKRIVIVGGGFAGVTLAQRLESLTTTETESVLVSSEDHLVFSPLLAEAVGREVSPLHVIVPGRQRVRRTQWLTARATEVDWSNSELHYTSNAGGRGATSFDHLVIACGSVVD